MSYYWVTTRAEAATALMFKSGQHLAEFFPRLLEHSTLCFSARDVLSCWSQRVRVRAGSPNAPAMRCTEAPWSSCVRVSVAAAARNGAG